MSKVKLTGYKPVKRLLDNITNSGRDGIARGIKAGLVHLYSKISPYPPAPAHSTYQRGTDPRSEQMSKQWQYEGRDLTQSLLNKASYSGYVHGSRQPGYHKRTGWKTVEQTLKDELPEVVGIVTTQYIKDIRKGV